MKWKTLIYVVIVVVVAIVAFTGGYFFGGYKTLQEPQQEPQYECDECGEYPLSWYRYVEHMGSEHNKPYVCGEPVPGSNSLCGAAFETADDLGDHKRDYHP